MNYGSGQFDVVSKVNQWIADSHKAGASDIHIEPMADFLQVRMRIDGDLEILDKAPPQHQAAIISRLKLMAKTDINERRKPQDGRFSADEYNSRIRGVDLRVNVNPTYYGEKIVLRIIDKSKLGFKLTDIGFTEHTLEQYRKCIHSPYGMILHTGPTGSGKTTTLYAALQEIVTPTRNINTVEDPIEYTIPGICHTQVNHDIELSFPMILRALLRQDPDVIMIGEVRDSETAQIAVEAAMTGHLIFSTLHTNSAVGAVSRLQDMGVSNYFVAHALLTVVAQRFARRLCRCKVAETPSDSLLREHPILQKGGDFYTHKGCGRCGRKGFKGRIALMEVLTMSEELRKAISEETVEDDLVEIALKAGMMTMVQDGLYKCAKGITSIGEVLRATGGGKRPKKAGASSSTIKKPIKSKTRERRRGDSGAITPPPRRGSSERNEAISERERGSVTAPPRRNRSPSARTRPPLPRRPRGE